MYPLRPPPFLKIPIVHPLGTRPDVRKNERFTERQGLHHLCAAPLINDIGSIQTDALDPVRIGSIDDVEQDGAGRYRQHRERGVGEFQLDAQSFQGIRPSLRLDRAVLNRADQTRQDLDGERLAHAVPPLEAPR